MEKVKIGSEFSVELYQAMDEVEYFGNEDDCNVLADAVKEDVCNGFPDAVKKLVAMMMNAADTKILVTEYPIDYPIDGGEKIIGITYQDESVGILVQANDVTRQIPMDEDVKMFELTLLLKRLFLAMTDEHFMKRTCPHCGREVTLSQIVPYSYQCEHCEEDFFIFETNCN